MPVGFKLPKPVKIVVYTGLVVLLLVNVLMMFAIDDTPLLKMHEGLNQDDILRAKQILQLTPEERAEIKTILLNEKNINIAASYLLNHFVENTVMIQLGENEISAQIAITVPGPAIWGRYLDVTFKLKQDDDGKITITSLKIGEISIPDPAANYLVSAIMHTTPLKKYWHIGENYLKKVQFTSEGIELSYL
jgi:hypothetical protein